MDYGINDQGLPVIVVYPDFKKKSDIINCTSEKFKKQIKDLWGKLPKFRDSRYSVPRIHVPNSKCLIRKALEDEDLKVQGNGSCTDYFYKC